MMRKFLFLLVAVVFCVFSYAQSYEITQNSYQKVSVTFHPGTLSVEDVSVPEGDFSRISMPEFGFSYNPGAPELPVLTKMLQIPVCDSVITNIVDVEFTEYDASELGVTHPVFPSQVSVAKIGSNPPFSFDQAIYNTDAFFSLPLVQVEKAGIKRCAALAGVHVSPVQYNPVTGKFRIYSRITVEFTFANPDLARTAELQKYASPLFVFDHNIVINNMQAERSEFMGVPIKYLIVANPMFSTNTDLEDFVSWKRRLGYLVEVVYTDDPSVGSTTSSIKSFIQGKYDNASEEDPAPTFLLFLGDREQLPAFNSQVSNQNHITDLYYATLAGNDYIPDCYYGRLSATNNQQLSNQIEKIMMYEQYTMPDPSYLGNAVLIAGSDPNFGPTHANGQVNYITDNYINNSNPRYSNVMAHLYNCSNQAALIRSEVSDGAGWVNYTAHGGETCWADPEFNTSQVYQLQNADKYGLMIGNCCQSGNFKTSECFGEALLRAEKKGAMGYIGASNNSYWGEDFYWAVGVRSNINANPTYMANALGMYDKLFHTHNEDYSNWVSTIGGIMTGGNMTVQSSSSSLKQYYWEIYHCFGDPSVRTYMGIPSEMTVTANPVIVAGTTSYALQVPPYAYVALTRNSLPIVTAFADESGNLVLPLSESMDPGNCELVVLAQNYIPYFMDVQVITPSGPYVIPTMVDVAENTVFNAGSNVYLNLSLSNVGVSNASQVYATLTPDNPMTMLSDSVFVGNINVNTTEERSNAFAFVMPEVEDYVKLPFTLTIHWNDTLITRSVNIRVCLPKVVLNEYTTTVHHNIVHSFSAGDQVVFTFKNQNKGHAAVTTGLIDLTCNYSGVTVSTDGFSIDGLLPNAVAEKAFIVQIADTVPNKSDISLYYHTFYENIHRIDTFHILVGGDFETFESGDFSQFNWTMNNYPWIISSGGISGNYCARSAQSLPNNSKSSMSITVSTTETSTLSYYRKVSSEAGYDKFYLKLDGNQVDDANGELPWTEFSIDVPAGTHSIVFTYEKDYSQASGSDCVWIDNVLLPCVGLAVIEDIVDSIQVNVTNYEVTRATVYPNPTSQWLVIESPTPAERVVLYDMNGRLVKTQSLNGETRCQVNVNDLPAGYYLMRVMFENGQTQNLKIIKR